MENKINLEEIIQECIGIRPGAKNTTPMDYGECKFVMKYFGEKLLQLAAKNAIIIDDPNSYCGNTGSEYPPDQIVSEQSILDTIKQIE